MSIKKSNGTIGNQTRNLPACSAVPQPTEPPTACPSIQVDLVKSRIVVVFLCVSVNVNASDTVREGYKKHSWSGTNTNRFVGLILFAGVPGYCSYGTGVNQCVLIKVTAFTGSTVHVCQKHSYISENKCKN
jgi:hypothetical protein